MAKKREPPPKPSATAITAERAARLYRLLALLGKKPQTRTVLAARIKMGVRGFYRDLEVLRKVGIAVTLTKGRYVLQDAVADAQGRLPFPDPGLTLGEALQLAKGRTATHRKLKGQIEDITE